MKRSIFVLLGIITTGCGGGGESNDSDTDLTGQWTLRVVTLESNCGDPINVVYSIGTVDIEQTGKSVTFQFDSGAITDATLSGHQFTGITLTSYPDAGGTTTETALQLTLNDQGNKITADQDWTWSAPDIPACNGKSRLVFRNVETPTLLEGSWQFCAPLATDPLSSALWTDTYRGSIYSYTVEGFNNELCEGAPVATKSGSGYIYLGDDILVNGDTITATEMEFEIVSTKIDGQSGQIADNMGGFLTGDVYFDLFHIADNQLYFSDWTTGDGLSSTTRPTDIDLNFYMTRLQ